jgi:hypothetical protein
MLMSRESEYILEPLWQAFIGCIFLSAGGAADGATAAGKGNAGQEKKRRREGKDADSAQTGNAWAAAKRKRMASTSSSAVSSAPCFTQIAIHISRSCLSCRSVPFFS